MAILVPALNASTEQELLDRCRIIRPLAPPLVQVDVSDGVFGVPKNVAVPSLVARELHGVRLDIHLMVHDVVGAIGEWRSVMPERITVHCEALADPRPLLTEILEGGVTPGLALGPDTKTERVEPFLYAIDFLLFVSVPPGRSGQPFDPRTIERVRAVRETHPGLNIGVDGGVTAALIPELLGAGATTICAASAIFDANDPREAYKELKRLVDGGPPEGSRSDPKGTLES